MMVNGDGGDDNVDDYDDDGDDDDELFCMLDRQMTQYQCH